MISRSVRRCPPLSPPNNGAIVGVCGRTYSSVCRMSCNKGYEAEGSAERRCIVLDNYNIMAWSGGALFCRGNRGSDVSPASSFLESILELAYLNR